MWQAIARLDKRLGTQGSAIADFALIAPFLIGLSLASLDLASMMFDYNRASEATRRAARTAAIAAPLVDVSALQSVSLITCQGTASGPVCTGAALQNPGSFDQILADARILYPTIVAENLRIEYRPSGIGSLATPGGFLPFVTVRLEGVRRSLGLMAGLPGVGGVFDLPEFAASHMGNGK